MINNNYSRKDHCNDHRKSFYTKAPPFRVAPNIRYQPEPNCSQPQIPQEEIENYYIFKLHCPNMRNVIIKILPSKDNHLITKFQKWDFGGIAYDLCASRIFSKSLLNYCLKTKSIKSFLKKLWWKFFKNSILNIF